MNAYEKIVDIVLAVIVMFVFVTVNFSQKKDVALEYAIQENVNAFVENVRVEGYVSRNMYESFQDSLARYGNYSIEMSHEQYRIAPDYSVPRDPDGYWDVIRYSEQYIHDEMLDRIYANGAYMFRRGDYFAVKVSGRPASAGSRFLEALFVKYNIEANGSGYIRAEKMPDV